MGGFFNISSASIILKELLIVQHVFMYPINVSEAHNELVICRIDHTSGRARGGDEVFLLCEKVNKGTALCSML